ncbi:hypothetical protein THAOC_02399 [Thalassiosira oceanica]|uniref:Helicase-associated domain-containing protein n=1 Tax=Thalassiosira oceanica TaxID=159749 RepID=K0TEN6_THAOC|nr:hypothetical protein THAOC_02399 [Thalassiosira oceanica]|eukprot:EJK75865.1 hypothetical protein THAOC_02399 [Thalassiosira oceanica]
MGLAWDADDDGPPGAPPPMPPSSSSHSSSGRRPPKSSDRLRGGGGGPAPRVEAEHDTKTWEERFAELRDFRDETGHANIPKSYGPNPGLGRWAAEQRGQYKRMSRGQSSTLTPGRADRLARLGFKWSAREGSTGSWENWLIELRRYRSEHGNVDVPLKYPGNPALGAFVNRQRTEYRKLCQGLQTSLTEERTKDLNALGFKWAIRVSRTPWDTRLEELRRFKEGEKTRPLQRPLHLPPEPAPGLLGLQAEGTVPHLSEEGPAHARGEGADVPHDAPADSEAGGVRVRLVAAEEDRQVKG